MIDYGDNQALHLPPSSRFPILDAEPVQGENLRPYLESLLLVEARYPRPHAVVAE